jgi:hypothetical protein
MRCIPQQRTLLQEPLHPVAVCGAAQLAVSGTNYRTVSHYHVVEPLGGRHICSRLPNAVGTPARGRRLEAYELYLCLAPHLVQGWAHAVMPAANGARRGLHYAENIERNRRAIVRVHAVSLRLIRKGNCLPHHWNRLRFLGVPVCALGHEVSRVWGPADHPMAAQSQMSSSLSRVRIPRFNIIARTHEPCISRSSPPVNRSLLILLQALRFPNARHRFSAVANIRAASWLRACRLTMTQELIANMLGVRREGVTEPAGRLHRAGVIRYT